MLFASFWKDHSSLLDPWRSMDCIPNLICYFLLLKASSCQKWDVPWSSQIWQFLSFFALLTVAHWTNESILLACCRSSASLVYSLVYCAINMGLHGLNCMHNLWDSSTMHDLRVYCKSAGELSHGNKHKCFAWDFGLQLACFHARKWPLSISVYVMQQLFHSWCFIRLCNL